jgi:hypothetical protein
LVKGTPVDWTGLYTYLDEIFRLGIFNSFTRKRVEPRASIPQSELISLLVSKFHVDRETARLKVKEICKMHSQYFVQTWSEISNTLNLETSNRLKRKKLFITRIKPLTKERYW